MAESEQDVVKLIANYRESQRLERQRQDERSTEHIAAELLKKKEALEDSFLIFQPIIEPMLHKIAADYEAISKLPEQQVEVTPFKPRMFDEFSVHPGHFALVWGYPKPIIHIYQEEAIGIYARADEKLKGDKKLSSRKKEHFEAQLKRYGKAKIEVQGFNALVFVADLVEGAITPYHPHVSLRMNNKVARTEDRKDGVKLLWNPYDATHGSMIPTLSHALNNAHGNYDFTTNVETYVSMGPKNIFPTGPFV